MARTLGVVDRRNGSVVETLADAIGKKELLLVLDNCEHLLAMCAELADRLLRSCPKLRILVTSREPLGIAGETVWRVPSLSVPDARTSTLPGMAQRMPCGCLLSALAPSRRVSR